MKYFYSRVGVAGHEVRASASRYLEQIACAALRPERRLTNRASAAMPISEQRRNSPPPQLAAEVLSRTGALVEAIAMALADSTRTVCNTLVFMHDAFDEPKICRHRTRALLAARSSERDGLQKAEEPI